MVEKLCQYWSSVRLRTVHSVFNAHHDIDGVEWIMVAARLRFHSRSHAKPLDLACSHSRVASGCFRIHRISYQISKSLGHSAPTLACRHSNKTVASRALVARQAIAQPDVSSIHAAPVQPPAGHRTDSQSTRYAAQHGQHGAPSRE